MPLFKETLNTALQTNEPAVVLQSIIRNDTEWGPKIQTAMQQGISADSIISSLSRNLSPQPEQVAAPDLRKLIDIPELRPSPTADPLLPAARIATEIVPQVILGTAGSLLGAASPVPGGTFFGGLAGNIAGKQVTKALNFVLDIDDPAKTNFSKQGVAVDAINATLEEGLALSLTAVGSKLLAPFGKKMIRNAVNLKNRFRNIGVEPTPGQVMQSAGLDSAEGILRGFVLTADEAKTFDLKQLEALVVARDNAIDRALAGAPKESAENIGRQIEKMLNDFVDSNVRGTQVAKDKVRNTILNLVGAKETLDSIGSFQVKLLKQFGEGFRRSERFLWDDIPSNLPNQASTHIDTTELKNLILQIKNDPSNPIPDSFFNDFLENTQELLGGKNLTTWGALDGFRRQVGRAIGQARKTGDIVQDAATGQLSRIYSNIFDTFDEFAKTSPAAGQARKALNDAIKYSKDTYKFLGDKAVRGLMQSETGQAKVFGLIMHPKGAGLVKVLKRNIGPASTEKLLNRAVDEIMQKGQADFTAAKGRTIIDRFGRETMEELAGPTFVQDMFSALDRIEALDSVPTTNKFIQRIINRAAVNPRGAVNAVFDTQNVQGVQQIKRIVSPDVYNQARGQYIENLLGRAGQEIDPVKISSELNKSSKRFIREVFPQAVEREFIRDFSEVTNAIARGKTGSRGLIFIGALGTMAIWNPATAATIAISSRILGKLYLSKAGRTWLMRAATLNPATKEGAKAVVRLAAIVTRLSVEKEPTPK